MKVGDLVKMKHEMWWKLNRKKHYTDACGIVYGVAGRGIKILMPDNTVKLDLIDHWNVINRWDDEGR